VFREPGTTVQFRDVHVDLPGGRARLHPCRSRPADAASRVGARTPYPLTLLSPASHRTINSIFGESITAVPALSMHPDDAGTRGLADGQRVRVWNDAAALVLPLRIDADTRPGVVVVPKGVWSRAYGEENEGRTVNALTPATLSDLGAGACFNDARVEVAAATG
jgi:anaerobic selenocysteine-containing dehydrogenase